MKNPIIQRFEDKFKPKRDSVMPAFRPGDTVRVFYKIQEGTEAGKFRLQPFEGVVLRIKKGGIEGTFTVRKIGANGVGVERVFATYSPLVAKVELLASGIVRRSRLYYLRGLSGKAARIKSRFVGKKEASATAEA